MLPSIYKRCSRAKLMLFFWEPFASEMLLQKVSVEFGSLYENSFRVNGLCMCNS